MSGDHEEAIPGSSFALEAVVEYTLERQRLAARLRHDVAAVLPLSDFDALAVLLANWGLRQIPSSGRTEVQDARGYPAVGAANLFFADAELPGVETCWSKEGARNTRGRAVSRVDGRQLYAYRTFWSALHGPIDPFYDLDHFCGNGGEGCVNPWHCQRLPPNVHRALSLRRLGVDSPASAAVLERWTARNGPSLRLRPARKGRKEGKDVGTNLEQEQPWIVSVLQLELCRGRRRPVPTSFPSSFPVEDVYFPADP